MRAPAALIKAAALDGLHEEAKAKVVLDYAKETRRRYTRELRVFEAFCSVRGACVLPASVDTIVEYIVYMKRVGRTAGGIDAALTAISTAHTAAGHNSPRGMLAVKMARRNIRREIGEEPTKKTPLRVDQLLAAVNAIDASTLLGKRDRALLLLGWAGAFRRSELDALEIERLEFVPEGLKVRLRKSKTNQTGKKELKAIPLDAPGDPVGALRVWLAASGRTHGRVFVRVDRWGNMIERLPDQAPDGAWVARVVKRRLEAVGIDPEAFSGHSLRRGLITEASAARKARHKIMAQSGHRTSAMVDEYIDDAELFTDNAASGLDRARKGQDDGR